MTYSLKTSPCLSEVCHRQCRREFHITLHPNSHSLRVKWNVILQSVGGSDTWWRSYELSLGLQPVILLGVLASAHTHTHTHTHHTQKHTHKHTHTHTHTHTHRNNLISLHFYFKKGKWANKNIIYGLILISTSIPLYYFQDILITFSIRYNQGCIRRKKSN